MKIVKLTNHCCFRLSKEAIALQNLGHEVHVITQKISAFSGKFDSVIYYSHQDQLIEAIKLHKDADVFHAHNEPCWFVNLTKAIYPNIPVVLDVHDSMLIRYPQDCKDPDAVRISVDERDNMQLADGLVFVSDPMADICRKTFYLKQPYTVLHSYVPKELYRIDAFRWIGGIVHEGRVDIPENMAPHSQFFSYCDYRELAKSLDEMGIQFFVFAPNRDIAEMTKLYNNTAIFQTPVNPTELIRAIGSHNYGILGNLTVHEDWKHAMPNKLFDYLAAGLPIIAINAPLAGKFVEENGFGMNITDPLDISRRWAEHREFRKNIAQYRYEWCMENHIHKVTDLYKELGCN